MIPRAAPGAGYGCRHRIIPFPHKPVFAIRLT